ncbi:MAG TPA: hypothetical protein VGT41_02635 [Candidatus Babeliales bacterium]|nr:hypothetical protein [Candidatus Babeliales bacterium]
MQRNNPFAEVIESELHSFLGQSWQWDTFPPFGSIVAIPAAQRTLFGIVYQIKTGSMDPVRYPFAYKKTEQELRDEQPQIFEFLKTSFSCLVVGYQEKGIMYYTIAPQPAKIHAFIEPISADLTRQFFASNRYLDLIFSLSNHIFNLDELLLATLKHQADLGILSEPKLSSFIESFSLHTGNDYRKLKLFLQRVEPLVPR